MRTLLTGATGFIGSQTARALVRDGHEVFALIRPGSNTWRIDDLLPSLHIVPCDLTDTDELNAHLERIQPEMALHLAWYAQPGVYLTSDLNIRHLAASLAFAAGLAKAGCRRLLVSGTCAEYDQSLGYLSETSPVRPTTLYAACKVALHVALTHLAGTTGMDVVWPRIFYVYGPFEDEQRLLPAVITPVLRGQPTRLTGGEQIRDYLHVEDVAGALLAVAGSDLTGTVNVGSGAPVTVREMALRIGEMAGRPDLVRLGDLPYRAGDPMFVCANNRLLADRTGWKPRYSLEQGLEQTVAWWRTRIGEAG
ncbi:MAG: NAD(P)-dependent oxidoreductase [Chloroflexi bacterium]|nr:NAD(P)-dependent oxidoreductase [Chloroflexota bacterium]